VGACGRLQQQTPSARLEARPLGCGHLTFGCQAWALDRPRPLAVPSAADTWHAVCPALDAWAASYVLGRLSAHKALGLMPV